MFYPIFTQHLVVFNSAFFRVWKTHCSVFNPRFTTKKEHNAHHEEASGFLKLVKKGGGGHIIANCYQAWVSESSNKNVLI